MGLKRIHVWSSEGSRYTASRKDHKSTSLTRIMGSKHHKIQPVSCSSDCFLNLATQAACSWSSVNCSKRPLTRPNGTKTISPVRLHPGYFRGRRPAVYHTTLRHQHYYTWTTAIQTLSRTLYPICISNLVKNLSARQPPLQSFAVSAPPQIHHPELLHPNSGRITALPRVGRLAARTIGFFQHRTGALKQVLHRSITT